MLLSEEQIENQINKITKKSRSEIGKMSKRKGKTGEKNIVNFLKDLTNLSWVRVPNSGSFTGGKNRERAKYLTEDQLSAMLSDIFPPNELFYKFIIESKFYKNFSFAKIIKKKEFNKKLDRWCKELLYDCITYLMYSKSSKPIIPLLWIRINNEGDWLLINEGYFTQLFDTKINYNNNAIYHLQKNYDNIDILKNIGFNDKWIFCKAKEFCINNKDLLFKVINI